MVALTQRDLPYLVLTEDPQLQAYRTDRIDAIAPICPAETGDLFCDQVSYEGILALDPIEGASSSDTGSGNAGLAGLVGLVVGFIGGVIVTRRRRGGGEPLELPNRSGCCWTGVMNEVRSMSGRWLAGKVGAAILTLIFVLIFNFFLFRAVGDPTEQLARLPGATDKELAQLRADYGLDKPLLGQFVDYAGDTATPRPRDQPEDARAGLGRDQGGDPVDAAAGRDGHPAGDPDRRLDGGEGGDQPRNQDR